MSKGFDVNEVFNRGSRLGREYRQCEDAVDQLVKAIDSIIQDVQGDRTLPTLASAQVEGYPLAFRLFGRTVVVEPEIMVNADDRAKSFVRFKEWRGHGSVPTMLNLMEWESGGTWLMDAVRLPALTTESVQRVQMFARVVAKLLPE
jgi:hypothetical protein